MKLHQILTENKACIEGEDELQRILTFIFRGEKDYYISMIFRLDEDNKPSEVAGRLHLMADLIERDTN